MTSSPALSPSHTASLFAFSSPRIHSVHGRLRWALPIALALSPGCASSDTHGDHAVGHASASDGPDQVTATAVAVLESRSSSAVAGSVVFVERKTLGPDGKQVLRVDVRFDITGLGAGETRGFHVHDVGDCSAPDAASAGAHFNPGGHAHGAIDHVASHAGDLGNITADDTGHASGVINDLEKISLRQGVANGIVGRSVIVHAKGDDFTTQPTGNAGPRVACGVVTLQP